LLVDEKHRILFANRAVGEYVGAPPEHAVGRRCPEVIHGCENPIPGCPLDEAVRTGAAVEREIFADDSGRWFMSGVYPTGLRTAGGLNVYLHTAQDITERRRTRDWLARVNEMFLEFKPDPAENMRRVIRLCRELTGAAGAVYCRAGGRVVCSAGLWEAPAAPGADELPEGRVPSDAARRDADTTFIMRGLHESGYAETDPDVRRHGLRTCVGAAVRCAGRRLGALCAFFDRDLVTDESERRLMGILAAAIGVEEKRREDDEALHRTQEQLWLSQKLESVGRLAGGVAHDFNNLLTVITGSCNLASLHLPDGQARSDLDAVLDAAERASSLTRQLLAFSRKQVMKPKVMDLNETVADTSRMLRRLIGEDIEFATRLDRNLGKVNADPSQVGQVILNLAVNARDAMPTGGRLLIETRNVELDEAYAKRRVVVRPGSYMMMAVTDTGTGMDAETQAHVFEPFFTTKQESKGTGLGLSTVYGIVKQSGGYVWVYSEPGHGTTFKVYLPKVEGEVEAARRKTRSLGELLRGHETVLVVEDETALLSLARRVLELGGYRVFVARDGREALRRFEEHDGAIQLMVTDVVMPGMDGRALAESVRGLYPQIKVIFISGYTEEAVQRHGVLMSGSEFLEKPFSASGLLRKVREVLG
jgi:PAS domain S-box-containing protein